MLGQTTQRGLTKPVGDTFGRKPSGPGCDNNQPREASARDWPPVPVGDQVEALCGAGGQRAGEGRVQRHEDLGASLLLHDGDDAVADVRMLDAHSIADALRRVEQNVIGETFAGAEGPALLVGGQLVVAPGVMRANLVPRDDVERIVASLPGGDGE